MKYSMMMKLSKKLEQLMFNTYVLSNISNIREMWNSRFNTAEMSILDVYALLRQELNDDAKYEQIINKRGDTDDG